MREATYGPRSRHNASLLIEAASELGYPTSVVKTTRGGYRVPEDVLEAALGIEKVEEGVFYPAPDDSPAEPQEAAPDEVANKPRGNASREEWAKFAEPRGITVTDDMSRDDIKNLVNKEE